MRLTRRYRFCASHRLHQPALSADANRALYGKCNNPFGHGHNYALEVSVEGAPDARTGLLVNPHELDGVVQRQIIAALDHRNLNAEAPEFADGAMVPTSECLAIVIGERLRRVWPGAFPQGPRLARVYLEETANNKFELEMTRTQ